MGSVGEFYLLDKRDADESARLNEQHVITLKVLGDHVLNPTIPKSNISRVADIGTGTGIWTQDVAAELSAAGNTSVETVGFDISAAQFPKNPAPGSKFVTADITKGFPEEYHNTFDVVHVRYIVLALSVPQIKIAVENALTLLKPGGYLQWTDFDHGGGRDSMCTAGDDELNLDAEAELFYSLKAESNMSHNMGQDVLNALSSLPAEGVQLTDHTHEPDRRPELRPLMVEWHRRTAPAVLARFYYRLGKTDEEIDALTASYQAKVTEMGRRGAIFRMSIVTVVARKK